MGVDFKLDSSRRDGREQLDVILAEIRSRAQDFFHHSWEARVVSVGPDATSYSVIIRKDTWPRLVRVGSPLDVPPETPPYKPAELTVHTIDSNTRQGDE